MTQECEKGFGELKAHLMTTPVLAYAEFKCPLILEVDAHHVGLGTVLSPEQDGKVRPTTYAIQSMTPLKYYSDRCIINADALLRQPARAASLSSLVLRGTPVLAMVQMAMAKQPRQVSQLTISAFPHTSNTELIHLRENHSVISYQEILVTCTSMSKNGVKYKHCAVAKPSRPAVHAPIGYLMAARPNQVLAIDFTFLNKNKCSL